MNLTHREYSMYGVMRMKSGFRNRRWQFNQNLVSLLPEVIQSSGLGGETSLTHPNGHVAQLVEHPLTKYYEN